MIQSSRHPHEETTGHLQTHVSQIAILRHFVDLRQQAQRKQSPTQTHQRRGAEAASAQRFPEARQTKGKWRLCHISQASYQRQAQDQDSNGPDGNDLRRPPDQHQENAENGNGKDPPQDAVIPICQSHVKSPRKHA
jgi:hypothetical protein